MNRRTFIAGAISAPVPIVASAAVGGVTDPHAEWVEVHRQLVEAFNGSDLDAEIFDQHRTRLEELISSTPARTLEGATAQLEFAISEEADFRMVGNIRGNLDGALLNNVIQSLKAMA